jgi:hypothetical protein
MAGQIRGIPEKLRFPQEKLSFSLNGFVKIDSMAESDKNFVGVPAGFPFRLNC